MTKYGRTKEFNTNNILNNNIMLAAPIFFSFVQLKKANDKTANEIFSLLTGTDCFSETNISEQKTQNWMQWYKYDTISIVRFKK